MFDVFVSNLEASFSFTLNRITRLVFVLLFSPYLSERMLERCISALIPVMDSTHFNGDEWFVAARHVDVIFPPFFE